jgi:hypothetical protein
MQNILMVLLGTREDYGMKEPSKGWLGVTYVMLGFS